MDRREGGELSKAESESARQHDENAILEEKKEEEERD